MRRIHTVLGMRGGSLLSAVCKSSSSRLPMITRRRHFSLDATMWIQAGLQQIQISTGLQWWATFASSTALVRVGLFPLVRRQHLASRQLAGAMPELNFLYQLLLRRLSGLNPLQVGERLRILSIFLKGVNACLSLHSASVVTVFVYPLANMAVFVTFVYSLRGMISSDQRPELQEGGFAWFTDLTQKDTSFLLPFLAIGVSYTALENALLAGATGGHQSLRRPRQGYFSNAAYRLDTRRVHPAGGRLFLLDTIQPVWHRANVPHALAVIPETRSYPAFTVTTNN